MVGPHEKSIEQTIRLAALIGDVMDRTTAIAIIELSDALDALDATGEVTPEGIATVVIRIDQGLAVPSGGTGTRRNPCRPEFLEVDARSGGVGNVSPDSRALFVPFGRSLGLSQQTKLP